MSPEIEKEWWTHFSVPRTSEEFFRPRTVVREHVPPERGYGHEGKLRKGERHCLFKYTVSGEGEFRWKDTWHRLPEGTAFLTVIPSDHYYGFPRKLTDEWQFIYITFDGEPSFRLVNEIVNRHGPVHHFPRKSPCIALMETYKPEKGPGDTRYVDEPTGSQVIHDFLMQLIRTIEAGATAQSDDVVRAAVALMHENYSTGVNAEEVAEMLKVSREHLSRLFRARIKISPYQYLRKIRLTQAGILLKDSRMNVKQVAAAVGFESSAQFCRNFKQALGMTPSEFRNRGSLSRL